MRLPLVFIFFLVMHTYSILEGTPGSIQSHNYITKIQTISLRSYLIIYKYNGRVDIVARKNEQGSRTFEEDGNKTGKVPL